MPAPLRINLSSEEDRTLRELGSANGVPVRIKQRAIALRLNAHGWNVPRIAEYLDWAQKTVRETIGRWQQGGLGGLWERAGRGKKPRWQESDWQALQQWLSEPRRYSARQLSERLAIERGIELSAEQVRRILKKKLSLEASASSPTSHKTRADGGKAG
ncbi:helix-turn-helix domain-containing protein [Phormidium nigroviride]